MVFTIKEDHTITVCLVLYILQKRGLNSHPQTRDKQDSTSFMSMFFYGRAISLSFILRSFQFFHFFKFSIFQLHWMRINLSI